MNNTTVTPEFAEAFVEIAAGGPSPYSVAILRGLHAKHVYAGTVPQAVKAKRRAVNKAARRARRAGR